MKLALIILADAVVLIIRLIDISTKIWYISTQDFQYFLFLPAFIVALALPFLLEIVIYFILKNKYFAIKLRMLVLFIVLDQFSISYLILSLIFNYYPEKIGEYQLLFKLFYVSPMITNVFQTVPLLIIQVFNCSNLTDWSPGRLAAVSASAGTFAITVLIFFILDYGSSNRIRPDSKNRDITSKPLEVKSYQTTNPADEVFQNQDIKVSELD